MKKLLLVTSAALALTACVEERLYIDPAAGGGTPIGFEKGPDTDGFSRGSLRGDIGPIVGFNDNAASVQGYVDEGYGSSSVTVTGVGQNGSGFVILDFYSMDLKTAPAGTYRANSVEMGDVGVIGCSDGGANGDIHYDGPAEDAEVTITDISPSEREVTVVASHPEDSFSDFQGVTESTASFRITR